MKPFFSFIIPTLNEQEYLPNLLKDLSSQHVKNFEIIIIDACSEDHTREKALEYSDRLPLCIFENKDRNISVQKNLGAQKAKGTYLVFLDADCSVDPGFTQALRRELLKASAKIYYPCTVPDSALLFSRFLFRLGDVIIKLSQKTDMPFSMPGSLIIEKDFFDMIGGFDIKLYNAEDHELVQRVRQFGERAQILNGVRVVYSLRRIRKDGWIKTIWHIIYASFYILIKKKITKKIFEYKMGGHLYKK